MNATVNDSAWMRLGAASRFLGVDPSTLRAWTDAGRVPAFRTPGGHRRYAVEDLRVFLRRGRAGVPRKFARADFWSGKEGEGRLVDGTARRKVHAQEWYGVFDPAATEAMRHTCRRLMNGLAGYVSGGARQGAALREGERAGHALGVRVAALGMTPVAATRAFLFFKKMVTDAASRRLPLSADRKVQSIRRIDAYLNHVLVEMMSAYEMRRERDNATTRKHDNTTTRQHESLR